jgi:hypothetical protein
MEPRMNADDVKTAADLSIFLEALVESTAPTFRGSLEEYLRALWKLIQEHREDTVSWSLLAHLLADAFITEPATFDEQWFVYTASPRALYQFDEAKEDDYEVIRTMILYQIADLRRMARAGSLDKSATELWLGIDSGSERWYNFTPMTFLGAASPLTSVGEWESPKCNWKDLARVLMTGQNAE